MRRPSSFVLVATMAVLLCGAIFGFFYAWVCSTMWGLDDADPRVAIAAMQAMNASVRNAVFFPAFFLTPAALFVAAWLARSEVRHRSAGFFLAAGLVYVFGGLLLTMTVNVPMNEALAAVTVPGGIEEAARVWADYSPRWQMWNLMRTVSSGMALLLGIVGVATAGSRAGSKSLGATA